MKKISIILCLLWMGFIFYMSSLNGIDSNKESYRILNIAKSEYKEIKGGQNINQNNKQTELSTKDPEVNNKPAAINAKSTEVKSKQPSVNNNNNKIVSTNKREAKLNHWIRKNAHAFEYLVLALLVGNMFYAYKIRGKNAVVYILFICLFYAVTDEFHQSFVPGRTSLVSDVLIDFLGSIIGMIIFYCIYILCRKYSLIKEK